MVFNLFCQRKAFLHTIKDKQQKKALIFIHGFSGDPHKTWRKSDNCPTFPELISDDSELDDYDIYSFGYKTAFLGKHYQFKKIADLLYSEIVAHITHEQIILIAHSQGGIIAQKYIVSLLDKKKISGLKRIKGIIYLSVPFEGSLLASLAGYFNNQAKAMAAYSEKLQALQNNWIDNEINKLFRQLMLYGAQDRVVKEVSARPSYMRHDNINFHDVDEDHTSICKTEYNSTTYKLVKQFLMGIGKEDDNADSKPMVLWVHATDEQHFQEDANMILKWNQHVDIRSNPRVFPTQELWNNKILPEIDAVAMEWSKHWVKRGGRIRVYAKCCLSGGFILGNRLCLTKGVNLEVDHYGEIWKTNNYDQTFKVTSRRVVGNNIKSLKAIVILSVAKDIQDGVQRYLENIEDHEYRTIVNIMPTKWNGNDIIQTDKQAVTYAQEVKNYIEGLINEGINEVHLFMNLPLSLAIITGHRLTGACKVHIYEYANPGYILSCKL